MENKSLSSHEKHLLTRNEWILRGADWKPLTSSGRWRMIHTATEHHDQNKIHTLNWSSVSQGDTFTSTGNLESPYWQSCMSLDFGRKLAQTKDHGQGASSCPGGLKCILYNHNVLSFIPKENFCCMSFPALKFCLHFSCKLNI